MNEAEKRPPELQVVPENVSHTEWELMERVSELETQLAEGAERDHVRDLEISSLRHELELRFAYNSYLEKAVQEQKERVEYLQTHLDQLTHVFAAESASLNAAARAEADRADAASARGDAEAAGRREAERLLLAERSRISYRLVLWLLTPLARRRNGH